MLAFLTPSLLVWWGMDRDATDAHHIPYAARTAFMVGALPSFATFLHSAIRVPELPLGAGDRARIAAEPRGVGAALARDRAGGPATCRPRCGSWR